MPVFSWAFAAGPQAPTSPTPDPNVLQQGGPLVPVQVEIPTVLAQALTQAGKPVPQPISGQALIDTGATLSAVDTQVVTALGIAPTGLASVGHAAGSAQQPVFPARIVIPAFNLAVDIQSALGAQIQGQGIIALLGRDFLRSMLLVYNGTLGVLTLSF